MNFRKFIFVCEILFSLFTFLVDIAYFAKETARKWREYTEE